MANTVEYLVKNNVIREAKKNRERYIIWQNDNASKFLNLKYWKIETFHFLSENPQQSPCTQKQKDIIQ